MQNQPNLYDKLSVYMKNELRKTIFSESNTVLSGLYCREDFRLKLYEFKHEPSPQIEKQLRRMCLARNIDFDSFIKKPDLSRIPKKEEIKAELADAFRYVYTIAPSASNVVQSIVRHYSPKLKDEPLRVAILKQFVAGGGMSFKTYDTSGIIDYYCSRMTVKEFECFKSLPNSEKSAYIASFIKDSIFETDEIPSAKPLLGLCDNFANGTVDTRKNAKLSLYQFAIMFNMVEFTPSETAYSSVLEMEKRIFHDYYCENVLRYYSSISEDPEEALKVYRKTSQGDGINYKNFAEIIYLYYAVRADLYVLPGERIDRANEQIQKCIRNARNVQNVPAASNNTKYYMDDFFSKIIYINESDLVNYIIQDYSVEAPSNRGTLSVEAHSKSALENIYKLIEEQSEQFQAYYESFSLIKPEDIDVIDISLNVDREMKQIKEYAKSINETEHEEYTRSFVAYLQNRFSGPENSAFIRCVSNLQNRLSSTILSFTLHKRAVFLYVLKDLIVNVSNPLSETSFLVNIYNKYSFPMEAQDLTFAIKNIKKLGFHLTRDSSKRIILSDLKVENPELEELIRILKTEPVSFATADKQLMTIEANLLLEGQTITRSEYISFYLMNYFFRFDIPEEISAYTTFADFYEFFVNNLNYLLENTRYQKFNEKNIFDIFIVIAIYFYITDNMHDLTAEI